MHHWPKKKIHIRQLTRCWLMYFSFEWGLLASTQPRATYHWLLCVCEHIVCDMCELYSQITFVWWARYACYWLQKQCTYKTQRLIIVCIFCRETVEIWYTTSSIFASMVWKKKFLYVIFCCKCVICKSYWWLFFFSQVCLIFWP